MAKRREPRVEKAVPVRIFGTDSNGQVFSEKLNTLNVSRHGAELGGVAAQLKAGEIIGLTYGAHKVHFRVMWVGAPNTPKQGRIGLLNLSPEKPLWDFALPAEAADSGPPTGGARDRRAHPRFKTVNSAEVYAQGEAAPIRARTADLSLGGCFIEMPHPLPVASVVRLGIWVSEAKLWVNARVITSTPGFGIGLQFLDLADPDRERLKRFLDSTIRLAR